MSANGNEETSQRLSSETPEIPGPPPTRRSDWSPLPQPSLTPELSPRPEMSPTYLPLTKIEDGIVDYLYYMEPEEREAMLHKNAGLAEKEGDQIAYVLVRIDSAQPQYYSSTFKDYFFRRDFLGMVFPNATFSPMTEGILDLLWNDILRGPPSYGERNLRIDFRQFAAGSAYFVLDIPYYYVEQSRPPAMPLVLHWLESLFLHGEMPELADLGGTMGPWA